MSHIHLIKKENYGIIQMDREKANPMNHEFVAGLRIALKNFMEDDSIKGAIINGKENFFLPDWICLNCMHMTNSSLKNSGATSWIWSAIWWPLINRLLHLSMVIRQRVAASLPSVAITA